jgi:hypothetical protein
MSIAHRKCFWLIMSHTKYNQGRGFRFQADLAQPSYGNCQNLSKNHYMCSSESSNIRQQCSVHILYILFYVKERDIHPKKKKLEFDHYVKDE